MNTKYNGQALQDEFVLTVLNNKRDGYFLEIGSYDPIKINNTFILENEYGWKGVMVERNIEFLSEYKKHRPNSIHLMQDATTIDYKKVLDENKFPKSIDYLQIDLEVDNRSTLTTLEILEDTVFDDYTFAVITFEHDIYRGDFFNTRMRSREIFNKRGYIRVFEDVELVGGGEVNKFEDWYIHPLCVDVEVINKIKMEYPMKYYDIISHIKSILLET